jgi:hypothetical protein
VTLVRIEAIQRGFDQKYYLVFKMDDREEEWKVTVDDSLGFKRGTTMRLLIQKQ